MHKVLVYSTRMNRRQIMENQLAKEARDKYIEELNVNMMLAFGEMTREQQLKDYGTTNLQDIIIN